MERFEPPHPMKGSAPKEFSLSIHGRGTTKIDCSFKNVVREHEIDAVITALLAVRPLLRMNRIMPLTRGRSLVPLPHNKDSQE